MVEFSVLTVSMYFLRDARVTKNFSVSKPAVVKGLTLTLLFTLLSRTCAEHRSFRFQRTIQVSRN